MHNFKFKNYLMRKQTSIYSILLLLLIILLIGSNPIKAQDKEHKHGHGSSRHDTTEFMNGGVKIQRICEDSMVICFSKNHYDHFDIRDFPCLGCKKGKYNGHWAGVEIGINGYANSNFNMDFPASENYLNMNTARSIMVNLNPFELNLNLVKRHFGLTSGLGFQLNNYYFTGPYMLIGDSSSLVAYKMIDQNGVPADLIVNKLFVSWLNVPILFEYQTNPYRRISSFHVALGVVGGVRICSYTKQTFESYNTTYYLQDQGGKTVASFYPDDKYIRKHDSYHLSPFKLDATIRIGWSHLNLWGTYSLTPMFQKNQGPELYMWNAGITLLGW
jgi:hypothetical protein